MAKKPPIRVALDLETTGLHPEQDTILEVAAIKFQGTEVLETFETFVAPGRSIPYRVQRLTGIKPEHVVSAPPFATVVKKLQYFLADYPLVGHSIPFDASFLRMRGLARTNPLVDTFELATVLLPSLASYNLGQVAEALGIRVPEDRHRAMVDTVLAMEVFLALHQRLQTVNLDLLNDLAHLDAPRSWPLLHFFRQELRDRQEQDGVYGKLGRGSLGDRFAAQLGMDPRALTFAVAQPPEERAAVATTTVAQETVRVAEPVSSLPKGYQAAHTAVKQALETQKPLLLELTTGTQDYAAVLQPALEWLTEQDEAGVQTERRFVLSCATTQQARRLMDDVLPDLLRAREQEHIPIAYLAERSGYLCTHRWFGAAMRRTSGELTAEQARGLAKLRLWTHQTLHGERRELTLLQQEISAWERISSGFEQKQSTDSRFGSSYQRCTYRKKGLCFVSLAHERVKAARIVVTTHAGMFDNLSQPNSLLAGIKERIILDADLLDEENARWGNQDFEQNKILRLLTTIGTEVADGRYQGLLALVAPALRENGPGGLSTTQTVNKSELDTRLLQWFQSLRQARLAVEKLFASFTALVEEHIHHGASGGREKGGRGGERSDQPVRLNNSIRQLSSWSNVETAWKQVAQRLQTVIDMTNDAEKRILLAQKGRQRLDVGSGEDSSVAAELVAVGQQLLEQKELAQRAFSFADSDTVYWLRMPPPLPPQVAHARQNELFASEPAPVLHSQLVQTASLLKRLGLNEHTSTIFAGTALSVDGSFSYMRQRLGLDSEECATFSVQHEHHEQTLLYLPNDVPEPNAPQYQRHLDETIIQLATALEGQVVALFTSHAALRSTYTAIKPLLEARNILVLGQGVDGSPRQLWQVFQSQERVVLLGTGTFWDALDEITRFPACLLITRMPMPVLQDPPISARVEQYTDQLHQMAAPMASLKVKRVLNRLAWADTKRNAVILFDRRITSKEYGAMILDSLPRCSQRQGAGSHISDTVLDWLTATGAWPNNTP